MGLVLQPFGDTAVRAILPKGSASRTILDTLRALPGVVDAVVSENHAAVTFEHPAVPDRIAEAIEQALEAARATPPPREHTVRVRYGSDDLDELAGRMGVTPDEAAALHADREYTVALIGFLPGFAYLRGLDPRLIVPRRASPRPRIEPLSVGIAGPYTGVYPFASPGGWCLVGRAVGFRPFDVTNGSTLALGDRVTFRREAR